MNFLLLLTIGYIISRIENNDKVCDGCINSVCSSKPLKTDYSAFVQIKEYKTGCLKYVTEECFQFFLSMEIIFRKCRSLILNNKRELFMKTLELELSAFSFSECHPIKTKMINRFIEFRCKNLGTLLTKNMKKSAACLKASKSIAMREAVKNKIKL